MVHFYMYLMDDMSFSERAHLILYLGTTKAMQAMVERVNTATTVFIEIGLRDHIFIGAVSVFSMKKLSG